jgi:phage/plasmid-associated DNA primase
MKNAVYIFADESIWGSNKKELGKLKAMISEATTTIEPKGKDVITIRNYRHFIFASNEEWPVALDPEDRR